MAKLCTERTERPAVGFAEGAWAHPGGRKAAAHEARRALAFAVTTVPAATPISDIVEAVLSGGIPPEVPVRARAPPHWPAPAPPTSRRCTMPAEIIAKALGGHRTGSAWTARCPAHDDGKPSLSICDAVDGKVLVRCHAGCDQERVIANLRSRGLWPGNGERMFTRFTPNSVNKKTEGSRDDAKRTAVADAIWRAALPSDGTLVKSYFVSRGLYLPPTSMLRFYPGLKHPSGSVWPAMVARVTRGSDNTPLGIHRTFLARDGAGKAPVAPQKMMLGPCRGGAVQLASLGSVLMVGEGIETCIAAMQATGHPAWAALSTSGMRTLDLPNDVRDVIVLADGDDAGEVAARDCAWRWKREGRRVRIAWPPQGMDFNDVLLGRLSAPIGGRRYNSA